ncbi:MAG TPA: UTP--glucose-1-phosphate uridylyltransferase [Rhodospirillaceae bacterium]|nr:MAG: UTP--glucose-1-phosphate uridylyltransferase [Alphaproteobacteria bacterium GWF2_58_20]HAU29143.1 UTP--glucose-1-phosphate uridylyltransferase [Rhodospirillaceae bacterium]
MKICPPRKAVFPIAGLGTRFLPATKVMPKEMLPIVDKPVLQYAVEEARDAGITDFIFITSHDKGMLEDHFDVNHELHAILEKRKRFADIKVLEATFLPAGHLIVTRQYEPLGLGHAVWCARRIIGDEPFAVLLPDDVILSKKPCLAQMMEVYAKHGGNVLATMPIPKSQSSRYGIIDVASEDSDILPMRGIVEKPTPEKAPSNLAVVGRYILQPDVFDLLEKQKCGAGGEIQLTDALATLIGMGQPFHACRFEGQRFDCGDKVGFLSANIAFALQRPDLSAPLREAILPLLKEI